MLSPRLAMPLTPSELLDSDFRHHSRLRRQLLLAVRPSGERTSCVSREMQEPRAEHEVSDCGPLIVRQIHLIRKLSAMVASQLEMFSGADESSAECYM